MRIRFAIISLALIALLGCGSESPKSKPDLSILPQGKIAPRLGAVDYVTPRALLDLLQKGERPQLYYLEDPGIPDQSAMIPLPGMSTINVGEFYTIAPKLSPDKPVYLACMFGDDSKRLAKELSKDGFDCHYLDGGMFNLSQQIRKNGWSVPTP